MTSKKLIAYLRCSTSGQSDDGYSLAMQKDAVQSYAKLYNYSVVSFVEDVATGKNVARDGLASALALLNDADGLIVYSLSRLSRSMKDLTTLVAEHFQSKILISITENIDTRTSSGSLMLNILGSINAYEVAVLSERTKAGLQQAKANGKRIGRPCYGSKVVDGKLVNDGEEMKLLRKVKKLRSLNYSFSTIKKVLDNEGTVQRNGRSFSISALQNLIGA